MLKMSCGTVLPLFPSVMCSPHENINNAILQLMISFFLQVSYACWLVMMPSGHHYCIFSVAGAALQLTEFGFFFVFLVWIPDICTGS